MELTAWEAGNTSGQNIVTPVPQGEIISFVRTVEQVIDAADSNLEFLAVQGLRAASFIRDSYSLAREVEDIVGFWNETIANR